MGRLFFAAPFFIGVFWIVKCTLLGLPIAPFKSLNSLIAPSNLNEIWSIFGSFQSQALKSILSFTYWILLLVVLLKVIPPVNFFVDAGPIPDCKFLIVHFKLSIGLNSWGSPTSWNFLTSGVLLLLLQNFTSGSCASCDFLLQPPTKEDKSQNFFSHSSLTVRKPETICHWKIANCFSDKCGSGAKSQNPCAGLIESAQIGSLKMSHLLFPQIFSQKLEVARPCDEFDTLTVSSPLESHFIIGSQKKFPRMGFIACTHRGRCLGFLAVSFDSGFPEAVTGHILSHSFTRGFAMAASPIPDSLNEHLSPKSVVPYLNHGTPYFTEQTPSPGTNGGSPK